MTLRYIMALKLLPLRLGVIDEQPALVGGPVGDLYVKIYSSLTFESRLF